MKKLILLSICGLLGCSATSLSAGDNSTCLNAENTLRDFYAAINNQHCDIAGKLRQGYDKKQCQHIKNATVISVQPQTCTAGQATFLLEVKFQKTNNRNSHFYGTVALANTDQQGWLITGFQSGNTSLASPTSPLMAACWTSAELNGNKQEKVIHKTAADHSPPAYDTPNAPAPTSTGALSQSIRSVALPADKKALAITFDLCEQANEKTGYDAEIINLLRASHVKATLFAGGKWMRSHPDRTQQLMADPLFELGNHAWTHGNLRV
ncbi:MAG: polysaccharide deacetylase family protein, partial [Methylovulum sp.]|nr:polysaccharide deacetylase family protein [Methylovulum sp.]